MASKINALLVEDDNGLCRQLGWALPEVEFAVAGNREDAISEFRRLRPAVVVLDLGLPPDKDGVSEGMSTLEAILALAPETKIIICSGSDSREAAVRAIALGAYDFCRKPIDPEALRLIIERAARLYELEAENRRLLKMTPRSPADGIIGSSPQMARLLRTIEKVAPTDVAVLLLGESGTGKELLAQALHRLSGRSNRPFVAINCAAIPETLLESELFGYEKGAFTGAVKQTIGKIEKAHEGTFFLDEIGDLPLAMQVKLLRFLQDHMVERIGGRRAIQVDVRIICATNQDLDHMIGTGRFREDLYYRLNEVRLVVPPLRERDGDAMLIAHYLLKKFNAEIGRNVKGFASDALAAMADHAWRGNVRELENRVKRAVVMAEGASITAADLELAPADLPYGTLDLREARARAERDVIQMAMAQSGGNLTRAAKLLGISRPTLYGLLETLERG
ncbi:MAG TPA: PEP-CTERM-box response regulator transcription factor [Stellaceae bacterium]|nr:PEP-CTERM-box response regulator transcription factor [Stellaceae bacterium]